MNPRSALSGGSRIPDLYLFVFFSVLTFILYYSSLNNFYVLDDFTMLRAASEGALFANFHFFPLPLLIYRLVYLLFGQTPVPLRIISYIINALMCVVVFRFSLKVLAVFLNEMLEEKKIVISFVASLLFCVHYIHVETVIYFSELHELLYSLFYLLGLYTYLLYRSNSRKLVLYSVFLFYLLCIVSKETAVTFIACIMFSELFIFKSSFKSMLRSYWPLLFITIGFISARLIFFPSLNLLSMPGSAATVVAEVIKNYIFSFTAFIVSLDFYSIKEMYRSNNSNLFSTLRIVAYNYPYAVAGVAVSFAVYYLMLKKFIKLRYTLIIFSIITISSFAWLAGYERYLYLPSVGFCLLLVVFLFNNTALNTFNKKPLFIIIAATIAYNVYSLKSKETEWITASAISEKAVTRIVEITRELPPGSRVYFSRLPGEYKSAWILRFGIGEIPVLFLKRNDIEFYYMYQKPENKTNDKNVYVYDYVLDKIYKE